MKCFMRLRSVHILHHTLHRLILAHSCAYKSPPLSLKIRNTFFPKKLLAAFPSDLSAYIRKWQIFGDFYTILSFSSFDIFATCSNRYHSNTFCGKFGFRSRVKLNLRFSVDTMKYFLSAEKENFKVLFYEEEKNCIPLLLYYSLL